MSMKQYPIILLSLCLLLTACHTRSTFQSALNELDDVIERQDQYQQAFEHRNDSLRARLASGSWESALALYEEYLHFSADSAWRYITLMEKRAVKREQALQTAIDKCYLLGTAITKKAP